MIRGTPGVSRPTPSQYSLAAFSMDGTAAARSCGFIAGRTVTVVEGRGTLAGPGWVTVERPAETELEAPAIVLATGSEPVELPFLHFDGQRIVSSTGALELP